MAELTTMDILVKNMQKEIRELKEKVNDLGLTTKDILTTEEASRYLGMSKSYLYKLTMRQVIPYYRPNGKYVYFERSELDKWLRNNPIRTQEQIASDALKFTMR